MTASSPVTPPLLETQGLVHLFENGNKGLDGVTLRFKPGEFTVLAGANGSGKTLFLRHLVGLVEADEGKVLLDGNPAENDWTKTRSFLGFLFQDADAQILEATVLEDALFGPRQLGLPAREAQNRARAALMACGLAEKGDELTAVLSGGEKRRLTLAGVLALEPSILLLDEPFSGLDQPGVEAFLQVLLTLHAQGRTIVLVTHDLEKCLGHADRLVLWKEGRILAEGTPDAIWEQIPSAGVHRPRVPRERWKELTWLTR